MILPELTTEQIDGVRKLEAERLKNQYEALLKIETFSDAELEELGIFITNKLWDAHVLDSGYLPICEAIQKAILTAKALAADGRDFTGHKWKAR